MEISFPLVPPLLTAALLLSACALELDPADLASSPCQNSLPPSPGVVDFMPDSEIATFCGDKALDEWAAWLTDHPDRRILLEGHKPLSDKSQYKFAYSQRIADAVRDMLVMRGIDPDRIESVSYGDNAPAVPFDRPGADYDFARVVISVPNQASP